MPALDSVGKGFEEGEIFLPQLLMSAEAAKQAAYAETVKSIMSSISPDLIAAIEMGGKCDLMSMMTEHMSPYALANGESVVETTQKLLNGLPFDVKEIVNQLNQG